MSTESLKSPQEIAEIIAALHVPLVYAKCIISPIAAAIEAERARHKDARQTLEDLLVGIRREVDDIAPEYGLGASGPGHECTGPLVCAIGDKMSELRHADAALIEQLAEDKKRIDWLESNHEFDIWGISGVDESWRVSRDDKHGGPDGGEYFAGKSLRAAIDAAIRAYESRKEGV